MKSLYTLFFSLTLLLGITHMQIRFMDAALPQTSEPAPNSQESAPSGGGATNSDSPLTDGLNEFGGAGSGLRTDGSLIGFVSQIISWLLGLVGTVFFVIILLNGFKYMTSGGNASNSQESVKAITNAVIGLVIIMGAFLITNYVTSALLSA